MSDEEPAALINHQSSLINGISLFNAQEFWHAHEAWETLWLAAEGERKQFLQGLIQLAAAYHHVKRGTSPRGAVRLFESALGRLQPFQEGFENVSRTEACATARIHRERVVNGERIEPDEYPKLGYNPGSFPPTGTLAKPRG